jgi:YidC/Oxa1 family membrane protein insertase
MQQKRMLLFVALMVALFGVWWAGKQWLFPQKPPQEEEKAADFGFWDYNNLAKLGAKEPPKPVKDAALHLALGLWDMNLVRNEAARLAAKIERSKPSTRVALGSEDGGSKYHLFVELDSKGACVRKVWLNKFRATDENGKPVAHQMELVPAAANAQTGSFVLYHFAGKDAAADKPDARPLATLGVENWNTDAKEELSDGRKKQTVTFTYRLKDKDGSDAVEICKVFSLVEGEYHIGLEVHAKNLGNEPRKFRYQLTAAHGLPIEGRWYTSTYRNAMIGRVDQNGTVRRAPLETSQQIGLWQGGSAVLREEGKNIRYAGVAIQYFFSGLVVDKKQDNPYFLTRARPTLESGLAKGKVLKVSGDGSRLVLGHEKGGGEDTYYFTNPDQRQIAKEREGKLVGVRWYTDPQFLPDDKGGPRSLVETVEPQPDKYHAVWEDDITVRVATDVLDLEDDKPVVHKYLLYNGPVKPMLLGFATGPAAVPELVVQRYEEHGLDTLTDSPSPGFFGDVAGTIRWTWVLVKCTNVMHHVLNWIYWLLGKVPWLPAYGLSIICLTVLVRGMMFPISRKGALMSIKMQAMAPEVKKLQEKYKDDRQQLQLATMDLYRKRGVNPLGTCWFMLLQMPIFMGLYYALQESITFRLAPFPPTWIDNLAAPDMLWRWDGWVPWVTSPEWYGNFLYLGPYLNILPIVAVALMIMQQKLITPPPTDEQQEMQQKMMKYMMVFMGLMFYKVASGLCIYFIASSLWGFAERKLLPKKKPVTPGTDATTTSAPPSGGLLNRVFGGADASTAVTAEAPGRPRQGRGKRGKGPAPVPEADGGGSVLSRLRRRLSEWWADVLKEASKKQR